MLRFIYFILISFVFFLSSYGQEPHFSMFYNAPMQLNPALTGNHDCLLRFGSIYKDQWRSVSNQYQTYAVFADAKIGSRKLGQNWFGVGIQFLGDKVGTGDLVSNDIKLLLAYHKGLLNKNKLVFSMGVSIATVNHSIDPDKLIFESQWTGNNFDLSLPHREPFTSTSIWYFDLNAGLVVTYRFNARVNANIGGAYSHLTKPLYSFFSSDNRLARKTLIHAGVNAVITKKTMISPKIYFSMQDKTNELLVGCNMNVKTGDVPFFLGLWYRWGRDIIPLVGLEYKNFQLMFAYDFNISKYSIATRSYGGFELSVVKTMLCDQSSFNKKSKRRKSNFQRCPIF